MEAQTVSLRMARYMEGTTLRWIGFVVRFSSLKRLWIQKSGISLAKKHIGDRRIQNGIVQVYSHNICYVLNGIAPVFQHIVKIRGYKGADLKDRRSSQTLIDLFRSRGFFRAMEVWRFRTVPHCWSCAYRNKKNVRSIVIKFQFYGKAMRSVTYLRFF